MLAGDGVDGEDVGRNGVRHVLGPFDRDLRVIGAGRGRASVVAGVEAASVGPSIATGIRLA